MKRKRIWKVLGILAGAVVSIIAAVVIYIVYFLPNIPVLEIKVERTAERIERGRYLAYHVTVCMDCHSTRNWSLYSGPMTPGTEGRGGETFNESLGFPGSFYSANITPYYLSDFSDGELYRVITSGVGKGNRPLFPVMPFLNYRYLCNDDVQAVIAFVRTLTPIEFKPPASEPNFPVNLFMHLMPQKAEPMTLPSRSDSVNYGRYLVSASGCVDCHTQFKGTKLVMDMAYAGGREFELPWGIIRSANITPDPETGIGKETRTSFINKFKAYDIATYVPKTLSKKDFNTIMPWTMFGGMEQSDLASVYQYLRTIKPIQNQVVKFTPMK
jgi:hypothetical protein